MQLITHRNHLDALPTSDLKIHLQARFDQLSEDTDVPPNIILVEATDDVTGQDYAFVGPNGLLSDLFEEFSPGEPGFVRPYEWVCHIPETHLYEALYLEGYDLGYLLLVDEDILNSHSQLKWIFTAPELGGLSEPQPLY
jgi:hypothetical protein